MSECPHVEPGVLPVEVEKVNLQPLLTDFVSKVSQREIDVYNEASLQFELAIYLRERVSGDYMVQLERNVDYFGLNKNNYLKKEMDVVIFANNSDRGDRHCIELKFPRNGQYPEQMFEACKDIRFLEQLMNSGFAGCHFVMFADHPLFYTDIHNTSDLDIYGAFRKGRPIKGKITKPTGKRDKVIQLDGEYRVDWKAIRGALRYCAMEVKL
jgi:hypothetical protein